MRHIPPTKNEFETQLTTVQANKSRLITLCRWVVEAVNGKLKNRFKLLRQDYFNRVLPHLFVDFKIAAALINALYKIAVDNENANEILRIVNQRLHTPSLLNDYVQLRNLNRQRAAFITLEANQLEDFRRLTTNEIFMISLESCQIELAKSYCSEHLRNGLYTIEVCRENELNYLAACNHHHQHV
ncbi:hypothetical protein B5X24_HaOG212487 [Helicoverpa armigera]|nr:hypothetical protein B5X24_HaOG212487 [Helicoverpa armigera]